MPTDTAHRDATPLLHATATAITPTTPPTAAVPTMTTTVGGGAIVADGSAQPSAPSASSVISGTCIVSPSPPSSASSLLASLSAALAAAQPSGDGDALAFIQQWAMKQQQQQQLGAHPQSSGNNGTVNGASTSSAAVGNAPPHHQPHPPPPHPPHPPPAHPPPAAATGVGLSSCPYVLAPPPSMMGPAPSSSSLSAGGAARRSLSGAAAAPLPQQHQQQQQQYASTPMGGPAQPAAVSSIRAVAAALSARSSPAAGPSVAGHPLLHPLHPFLPPPSASAGVEMGTQTDSLLPPLAGATTAVGVISPTPHNPYFHYNNGASPHSNTVLVGSRPSSSALYRSNSSGGGGAAFSANSNMMKPPQAHHPVALKTVSSWTKGIIASLPTSPTSDGEGAIGGVGVGGARVFPIPNMMGSPISLASGGGGGVPSPAAVGGDAVACVLLSPTTPTKCDMSPPPTHSGAAQGAGAGVGGRPLDGSVVVAGDSSFFSKERQVKLKDLKRMFPPPKGYYRLASNVTAEDCEEGNGGGGDDGSGAAANAIGSDGSKPSSPTTSISSPNSKKKKDFASFHHQKNNNHTNGGSPNTNTSNGTNDRNNKKKSASITSLGSSLNLNNKLVAGQGNYGTVCKAYMLPREHASSATAAPVSADAAAKGPTTPTTGSRRGKGRRRGTASSPSSSPSSPTSPQAAGNLDFSLPTASNTRTVVAGEEDGSTPLPPSPSPSGPIATTTTVAVKISKIKDKWSLDEVEALRHCTVIARKLLERAGALQLAPWLRGPPPPAPLAALLGGGGGGDDTVVASPSPILNGNADGDAASFSSSSPRYYYDADLVAGALRVVTLVGQVCYDARSHSMWIPLPWLPMTLEGLIKYRVRQRDEALRAMRRRERRNRKRRGDGGADRDGDVTADGEAPPASPIPRRDHLPPQLFTLKEIQSVFRQLLQAVYFLGSVAHVVHLDIKPANVLIRPEGVGGGGGEGVGGVSGAPLSSPPPSASSYTFADIRFDASSSHHHTSGCSSSSSSIVLCDYGLMQHHGDALVQLGDYLYMSPEVYYCDGREHSRAKGEAASDSDDAEEDGSDSDGSCDGSGGPSSFVSASTVDGEGVGRGGEDEGSVARHHKSLDVSIDEGGGPCAVAPAADPAIASIAGVTDDGLGGGPQKTLSAEKSHSSAKATPPQRDHTGEKRGAGKNKKKSHHTFSDRNDVWSIGCVMLEMLDGLSSIAWDAADAFAAQKENYLAPCPKHVSVWPAELVHCIALCFERDPRARWGPRELLQHPFLVSDLGEELLD